MEETPEAEVVVEEDDDDGESAEKFPVMIIYLGVLLLAITITAIAERLRKKELNERVH